MPISKLFAAAEDHDRIVAFGADHSHSWLAFRRDVGHLTERLRASGGRRFLVVSDDAYAFAVALLAVLHAGAEAVIPASYQSAHLTDVSKTVDALVIHGNAGADHARWLPILIAGATEDQPPLAPLDPDNARIVLHTSGTSGAGIAVNKPLRCFETEVETLEALFGGPNLHSVLATVLPHHIYGLLFRILWPLSAGRPFA
ncbi:MAG TPA: hypothetical protein P5340_03755, partial [Defluviicoccus sp.]|nr:hypothetical protein [Defluviicoccus sp.]